MQKELERIVKEYGLENTRIQRGRHRLYPQREGLNATPEQLADLRSALEGNSVKGTLRITSGEDVILANTVGALDKTYDRSLMPAQAQRSTPENPVESNIEVPLKQDPVEAAIEGLDRMEGLIEQMNPDTNVVDAKARFEANATEQKPTLDKAQKVDTESAVVSPIVESPKERSSDLDYPSDAQTLDPTVNLKSTIAQETVAVQKKVSTSREILELAQKNVGTFTKHVKHRGLKAWAKEQLPILQNKVKELVQAQAVKLSEYVKEQAPVVKEAVIAGAKQAGEYAREQAPVVRDAAIADAKQVGEYVKEHAPIVKDAAITGAKQALEYATQQVPIVRDALKVGVVKAGDAIFQLESTPVIDAPKIQELGARVLAGDAQYQGKVFNFAKTETGVNISLKNGTPVFADGKLNPKLANVHVSALSQLAEKMAQVKAPVPAMDEKRTKAVAR